MKHIEFNVNNYSKLHTYKVDSKSQILWLDNLNCLDAIWTLTSCMYAELEKKLNNGFPPNFQQ